MIRPVPQDTSSGFHDPVMLNEMLAALAPVNDEIYVDGTFGAGGYTRAILQSAPGCRVIAFDRDPEARVRFEALPSDVRARVTFVDAPFSQMRTCLEALGQTDVNGVVLDLGVSSPQLDQAERGFSFRFDGPLDMRMDPRSGESAADVVNGYDEKALADIIYQYGEERQSRSVARAIVTARKEGSITSTQELATIIRRVIRKSPKDTSDPCTRTFQGLRIFVNRELDELDAALDAGITVLKEGGRLVVVTFHSLEDRMVKQFMQDKSGRTARPSRYAPDVVAASPVLNLPSTKALPPSDAETRRNPRARSAHLRVAIRTAAPLKMEAVS